MTLSLLHALDLCLNKNNIMHIWRGMSHLCMLTQKSCRACVHYRYTHAPHITHPISYTHTHFKTRGNSDRRCTSLYIFVYSDPVGVQVIRVDSSRGCLLAGVVHVLVLYLRILSRAAPLPVLPWSRPSSLSLFLSPSLPAPSLFACSLSSIMTWRGHNIIIYGSCRFLKVLEG